MENPEQLSSRDWRQLVRNVHRGKCTPLVGDSVVCQYVFGDDDLCHAWADDVDCPESEARQRANIAQYLSAELADTMQVKDEYLDFLKLRLLDKVKRESSGDDSDFLEILAGQIRSGTLSLTELAKQLDLLNFASDPDNPFRILADLHLPVYLTTSYHGLLEEALRAAGRKPESAICLWHEELEEEAPSIIKRSPDFNVFLRNPGFEPSADEPLVYYLHGRETHPGSMVLSQDEYLDFFLRASSDQHVIPPCVDSALASSSLLLLGYSLRCWDFRVILRGLIKAKETERRPKSVAIQLPNEDRAYSRYLENYFMENRFVIFWGTAEDFLKNLRENLEGSE